MKEAFLPSGHTGKRTRLSMGSCFRCPTYLQTDNFYYNLRISRKLFSLEPDKWRRANMHVFFHYRALS